MFEKFCTISAEMVDTWSSNDDWKLSTFSIKPSWDWRMWSFLYSISYAYRWKNALQFPQFQELLKKKILSFINFIKSSRQKFYPRLSIISLASNPSFTQFKCELFFFSSLSIFIPTPNSFPFTHHCRNNAVSVAFHSKLLRLIGTSASFFSS